MAIDRPSIKGVTPAKLDVKDLDDADAKPSSTSSLFDQSGFSDTKKVKGKDDEPQRFVGNKPGQTGKLRPDDDGPESA